MATINGSMYNDNNTITGIPNIFRPALSGVIDPGWMLVNGNSVYVTNLPDTINGHDGYDILNALDTDDTLNGGNGGDILNGGHGNDTLNGESGKDSLNGEYGNDVLKGGDGDDKINGGMGDDWIDGGFGLDVMNGDMGIDTLDMTFYNGAYTFYMDAGTTNFVGETAINFENVNTGGGNDIIVGTDGKNILNTGAGDDTLTGGKGNDILNGGANNDWIDGGDGLDIMDGGSGIDTLDVAFLGSAYTLNMNTGATNFAGETATNFENVNTGGGNDKITGTDFFNIINAGAGNDIIYAGGGNDTLNGGDGNDAINGGLGEDVMDGGSGIDMLDVTFWNGAYTLDMNTGITNYSYETAKNFEDVFTGGGNDTITGTADNNAIITGAGDDTLIGGDGNDLLRGMTGNDTLNGGSGDDHLAGGLGKDVMSDLSGWNHYYYYATNESTVGANRDIILDFEGGVKNIDNIYLTDIDADLSLTGNDAFVFIGNNAFTGSAGEVRWFTSGSDIIVQVEINGDGNVAADMEIQLSGIAGQTLSAADFNL